MPKIDPGSAACKKASKRPPRRALALALEQRSFAEEFQLAELRAPGSGSSGGGAAAVGAGKRREDAPRSLHGADSTRLRRTSARERGPPAAKSARARFPFPSPARACTLPPPASPARACALPYKTRACAHRTVAETPRCARTAAAAAAAAAFPCRSLRARSGAARREVR